MRNLIKRLSAITLALLMLLALPMMAAADDRDDGQSSYYTISGPDGEVLLRYGGTAQVDDEYISSDNRHYRISAVNDADLTATAEFLGEATLAEWNAQGDVPASANSNNKLIAIYHTHSDECYVPTDGVESKKNNGGINDVGDALREALEKRGIQVIHDTTNHFPHDAGAYRRSRQTAAKLMQQAPVAILDVHRDGIPAEEYEKNIAGEEAAQVRLLVGRANQNRSANQEFAKQLKAVADKQYPGLIKDIYVGKGNYNQELMPQAILLEFGTYENEKERALKSTDFMADVIATTLFGGSSTTAPGGTASPSGTGSPNASAAPNTTVKPGTPERQSAEKPLASGNRGNMTGILVVLGILLVGGGIFLAFSRGEGSFGKKLRGFTSELTGGAIGNRRKK